MDPMIGAIIIFGILGAIAVLGYLQASATGDKLDRQRRAFTDAPPEQYPPR